MTDRLKPLETSLHRPDHEPGVDGQLISQHLDRIEHAADRLRDGARPVLIDDEVEQLLAGIRQLLGGVVADEPGKGRGDPGAREPSRRAHLRPT